MYVIKNEKMKVPLKVWSREENIEPQCIEQMQTVCSLPFIVKHAALMPDAHFGKGCSIGSVIPLKNIIIPSLIGVDIGCGMTFQETNIIADAVSKEDLKKIMGEIRRVIPVGFNKQKDKQDEKLMPLTWVLENSIVNQEYKNALYSIGTLGGGNHFIEIQKNKNNQLCVMIHSGSRNLGKKVADHYNNKAKELNVRYFSSVLPEWGLAFLPLDDDLGKNYIEEMNYCVEFALANRKLMMNNILKILMGYLAENDPGSDGLLCSEELINIPHNYARLENHFGENVMIHRKGATSAKNNEIGIIPGSQGSKSYIVKGKGNKESFESCSHGAGRKMGRKQAQKTLNLKEEIENLNKMGIVHAIRNEKDLDEAPGSYKDIDIVMEEQKDLVDIVMELTPLAVIKG